MSPGRLFPSGRREILHCEQAGQADYSVPLTSGISKRSPWRNARPRWRRAARCDPGSLADRFNHLIKFFDEDPGRRVDDGELLWDKFVETAVSLLRPPRETPDWLMAEDDTAAEMLSREAVFRRALELDQFMVSGNTLHRALPLDVGLPAAQSEVDRLLDKHGLTTPKGHLKQALDAHGRGDWAAANSQIRAFFDALLDDVVGKLDASAATLSSGQPRRAKLAAIGFLSRDLNEWADNGTGFVNGLVRRLHPQGPHPGLSDQEDSTFRLRHLDHCPGAAYAF